MAFVNTALQMTELQLSAGRQADQSSRALI